MTQTTTTDIFALAQPLSETVWRAGKAVMLIYADDVIAAEAKADNSPVTKADQAAEDIILADLARVAPDIPVIAEEAASDGKIPDVAERFFLVDPLDGTKEFITKNGEFTLNIGYIERGVPRFGIVYAPAISDFYVTLGENRAARCAMDCTGDTFCWEDLPLQDIKIRPASAAGLIAVTSRSHLNETTKTFLGQYKIAGTTASGSSLKFCVVARGDADVYPRLARTMEWDTAAGQAVLLAAGGQVVTEDGPPLTYGKKQRGYDNPGFIAWGNKPA